VVAEFKNEGDAICFAEQFVHLDCDRSRKARGEC
jgi:hypothetical protein